MSKSSGSIGDNSSVQIKQESSSSKEKERRDRKRKAPEGTNDLEEEPDGMNAANFGSFEDCLGSIDPKKHRKKKKLSGAKLSAAVSPKMTVSIIVIKNFRQLWMPTMLQL